MDLLLKGNFNLLPTQQSPHPPKRPKSKQLPRDKSNKSLAQAGKHIISNNHPHPKIQDTPIPDILDDQVNNYILRQFQAQIPPPPSVKSIKSQKRIGKDQNIPPIRPNSNRFKVPPNTNSPDGQLLTSMANRLKQVESTNKSLKQELKQKNNKIDKINSQNIFLKGLREDSSTMLSKMQTLEQQNSTLTSKVKKMQSYLQQYGLKWVGDSLQGTLQKQKLKKAIKKGNYNYRLPSQIDINTIMMRIQQLNARLHSQGMGTELYQQNGIHKFKKTEPLPLGFFSDGVAIKGYDFYPYKCKQSLGILGDLIDGYFPHVLKHRYPQGVFLVVRDRLTQKYDNLTCSDNNQQNNHNKMVTFQSKAEDEFKPQSKQQFLSNLPKQIIKKGKIIPIRSQIQKKLTPQGQSSQKHIIHQQPHQQDQQTNLYVKQQGSFIAKTPTKIKLDLQVVDQSEICTLKIRNQQGEVYILHLQLNDNMEQVYKWMEKITGRELQLMGNYPRRTYDRNQNGSLNDLGFCPNGLLHLQSKP